MQFEILCVKVFYDWEVVHSKRMILRWVNDTVPRALFAAWNSLGHYMLFPLCNIALAAGAKIKEQKKRKTTKQEIEKVGE